MKKESVVSYKKNKSYYGVLSLIMILILSSAVFAVTSVTITSPNGGEYLRGTSSINWTYTGTSSDGFKLFVILNTTQYDITQSIAPGVTSYGSWDTTARADANSYKIYIVDKDVGSSASDLTDNFFTIDNTAPTVNAPKITYPTSQSKAKNTDSIKINASVSDGVAGVSSVLLNASEIGGSGNAIMFDDGTNGDLTSADGVYTAQITISGTVGDSDKTIKVTARDNAGNENSNTRTVSIDNTAPISSANILSAYQKTSTFNVEYTANDAVKLYYNNSGTWTQYGTIFTSSPISFNSASTGNDGIYGFYTIAVDTAGNLESAPAGADTTTTVDTIKPTTSDNSSSGWKNYSVVINLTVSDPSPSSGIEYTKYCTDTVNTCDPVSGTDFSVPITISSDGENYLRYHSKDNAGNTQSNVSKAIQIDTVKPTSSASALATYQTSKIFSIAYTASDALSEIAGVKLYYQKDSGAWTQFDGTFTSSLIAFNSSATGGDGVYGFYTLGVDNAGNIEDVQVGADTTTTVDTTIPTITSYNLENSTFSPNGDSIKDYAGVDLVFSEAVRVNINIKNSANTIVRNIYSTASVTNTSLKSWNGNDSAGTVVPSGVYIIEVNFSDPAGNLVINNSKFFVVDTINPSVTISSPNGGQFLKGGSAYNITWTATDTNIAVNPIKLEYFDGTNWLTIAESQSNAGTYSWTVPTINTNESKIRVTANDSAGNSGYDISDNYFTIDSTSPSVTVNLPNGTEIIKGGSVYTITWTATDINIASNPIKLEYFNGTNWLTITESLSNSGTYSWTVPTIDTSESKIRVTANDIAGNSGNDVSDNNFIIDSSAPSITSITNIAAGKVGSPIEINATITDSVSGINVSEVKLYYNNGALISLAMTNTGSLFTATIPAQSSSMTLTYYIVAKDIAGNSVQSSTYTASIRDLVLILSDAAWNLISVPKKLSDNSTTNAFSTTETVWEYDSNNKQFTHPNIIQPGKGYWVSNRTDAGLNYAVLGGSPPVFDITEVQLYQGWNLLGHMCKSNQNVSEAFPTAIYNNLFVLRYNEQADKFEIYATQGTTKEFSQMKTGEGYWVFLPSGDKVYTNVCS